MTKTLELTPAELEMVALKREQEALAKKEAELKKQAQMEKEIVDRQVAIAKNVAQCNRQVKAVKDFAAELGKGYEVAITVFEEEAKVTGDYITPEDPKGCGYEREVLWSQKYNKETARIKHGNYTITVDEQFVYGSKWSYRATSKGYKMYVSGPGIDWKEERRALGRISTVKEKIKTAMEKIQAEENYKNAQKNSLEKTVDKFKAEYPDAEVTTEKGYDRGYGKRYSEGVTYDMVRVKFANGCSIAYRVYADGSLGRISFNLPAAKDEAAFRKNLSQMKF
jgi:hypoxanthine-guanine phosphoribosyltransferase